MPSLLTFGVCRNAIVDSENNAVSLISLVNNLTLLVQVDQVIAPDMNSPIEWAVVTAWLRHEEDIGKAFVQRHLLITPDGNTVEHLAAQFNFDATTEAKIKTAVTKAVGFPIGQVGEVKLRVELQEVGSERWTAFADYPIQVTHQVQEGGAIAPT